MVARQHLQSRSALALAIFCGLATRGAAWMVGSGPIGSATSQRATVPFAPRMTVSDQAVAELPAPPIPSSSLAKWEVHKFGGASLATAELYKECGDLLVAESFRNKEETGSSAPTMAIVSAKGGVTDRLIKVVQAARSDMGEAAETLRAVAAEQVEVVKQLSTPARAAEVEARIAADSEDIINVVRAVGLLKTIPPSTMELVTGYGEVWSAMTMHAYLETTEAPSAWLDAREVLVVEQTGFGLGEKGSANVVGVDPLWDETADRVKRWFDAPTRADLLAADCKSGAAPIVVVTGFVAATLEGTPTTLKRSGSDFSATIFARLMSASKITMWKNVNGVYTADPRRVPEAFPIESLKYDEAIELAYFGAQVLHPSAMLPCIQGQIPIYVRNVFNPTHPGTVIEGRACALDEAAAAFKMEATTAREQSRKAACPVSLDGKESPIRGITSVDNVCILNVEGTGTSAVPDLAGRLFTSLANANVQLVMVTQASADSSICIVVEEGVADRALSVLQQAFERELNKGLIGGITAEPGHSVVAIVGEGMAFRPGTGATFTKAMANSGINIRTIAQGSSERQISIVVEKEDCTKALRAAHAALALSNTQLSVAVIGSTGMVGKELMDQLGKSNRVVDDPKTAGKRKVLDDLRLDFKVTALAREKAMRLSYDGLTCDGDGASWEADGAEPTDLDALTRFLNEDYNGNRVVIDCSASQVVADKYASWMASGIHVITANKKAGSGPQEAYDQCKLMSRARAQWLYETTGPGSGLPVLTTLKDMTQSGDRVHKVRGVFSGSMSYILNEMAEGVPLSSAVLSAADMGLCEPDPREDLLGMDVRRKVVVLARELGLRLDVADVETDSLLPDALVSWKPDTTEGAPPVSSQLSEALRPYDDEVSARVKAMAKDGEVAVQLSLVDVESGVASIKLIAVPASDRCASCDANENIVEITTQRYSPRPMVLQGPGAGAEITASGLFADLLHLSRTLVEWNIPQII
mmetsp:Transcript_19002/g.48628  ORF Transcript_19002/g.48628 Transcript_19002/m.48628 type:complete len:985 (+) Transcript_19002:66-3020(+)